MRRSLVVLIGLAAAGCIPSPEGGSILPGDTGSRVDSSDTGVSPDAPDDEPDLTVVEEMGPSDMPIAPDTGSDASDASATSDATIPPDMSGDADLSDGADSSTDVLTYVLVAGGQHGLGGVDTELDRDSPEQNYANRELISADDGQSALFWWDTRPIPTDAVVVDARVEFHSNGMSSGDFQVFEISRTWFEDQATWNNATTNQQWQAPGCSGANDRGSTIIGVVGASDGDLTGDVVETPELLALVRKWVANVATNHGLIVAYVSSNDGLDFHTSESPSIGLRPALIITVEDPAL